MRICMLLSVLLAAVLTAQDAALPSEVVANGASHIGKRVTWVGKQIRISTTMLNGKRVITNRVFALLDAQGKENRSQIFAVEGDVTETDAARKLNATHHESIPIGSTPGDPGIRRVEGVVGSIGDIEVYVDGKPGKVKGPKLTSATLDAK